MSIWAKASSVVNPFKKVSKEEVKVKVEEIIEINESKLGSS